MKIALLTQVVSPHQMPLAEALVRLVGKDDYRYVFTEELGDAFVKMGWDAEPDRPWCIRRTPGDPLLEEADAVMSGLRALSLFEKRAMRNLATFYTSDRWFKSPLGFFRMFSPSFFRMALRFSRCVRAPGFLCLPVGIHAARDMARLLGLLRGDLRCLFRAPRVAFEPKPGGVVVPLAQAVGSGALSDGDAAFARRRGFVRIPREHWGEAAPSGVYSKMRLWGYFVAPPEGGGNARGKEGGPIRLFWAGRMVRLKRVDTLIRAVLELPDVALDLYGRGPEEKRLRRMAAGCGRIAFHDFVPIRQIRSLMRRHDVYVQTSDGGEGWGAVVSEALEEGMAVYGTEEAGSSATLLPRRALFRAKDAEGLAALLRQGAPPGRGIGDWAAEKAARIFLGFLKKGNRFE